MGAGRRTSLERYSRCTVRKRRVECFERGRQGFVLILRILTLQKEGMNLKKGTDSNNTLGGDRRSMEVEFVVRSVSRVACLLDPSVCRYDEKKNLRSTVAH